MPASPAPVPPRAPRENLFLNLACTIAVPALILSKLSAPERLGAATALVVALAFPLGYGAWDFIQRKKRRLAMEAPWKLEGSEG